MSEHSDRIVLIGIANDEIEANIWRDILAREAIAVFVKNPEPLAAWGAATLTGSLQIFVQAQHEKRARWLLGDRVTPS